MTTERRSVEEAANQARMLIDRVVGNGDGSSWLNQMEAGDVPADWPRDHAQVVAEMLGVLGERARHTRAIGGSMAGSELQAGGGAGFIEAGYHRLPLNRKERYFTGTVLPMLIADNGFAHLHRFLNLCGVDAELQNPQSNPSSGTQDIQFFTEYSFAESVHTPRDKKRLADRPSERDTPDVVLLGPDWLVAVEAKMYHRPTRDAINAQLRKQRVLVNYWSHKFGLDPSRVAHVLLLPDGLAADRLELDAPVVSWEQVRDAYSAVAPAYWLGVLRHALERYDELRSPEPPSRHNADEMLTGTEIAEAHADGTLIYAWMGRSGVSSGKLLTKDIADGGWRERRYEVRREPLLNNKHWFAISGFIAKTSAA